MNQHCVCLQKEFLSNEDWKLVKEHSVPQFPVWLAKRVPQQRGLKGDRVLRNLKVCATCKKSSSATRIESSINNSNNIFMHIPCKKSSSATRIERVCSTVVRPCVKTSCKKSSSATRIESAETIVAARNEGFILQKEFLSNEDWKPDFCPRVFHIAWALAKRVPQQRGLKETHQNTPITKNNHPCKKSSSATRIERLTVMFAWLTVRLKLAKRVPQQRGLKDYPTHVSSTSRPSACKKSSSATRIESKLCKRFWCSIFLSLQKEFLSNEDWKHLNIMD